MWLGVRGEGGCEGDSQNYNHKTVFIRFIAVYTSGNFKDL